MRSERAAIVQTEETPSDVADRLEISLSSLLLANPTKAVAIASNGETTFRELAWGELLLVPEGLPPHADTILLQRGADGALHLPPGYEAAACGLVRKSPSVRCDLCDARAPNPISAEWMHQKRTGADVVPIFSEKVLDFLCGPCLGRVAAAPSLVPSCSPPVASRSAKKGAHAHVQK